MTGDLVLPALRALLPRGPVGLDTLARRVVHGGAHVLVGLAFEREAGQVEERFLGDLHDCPAVAPGGLREVLVDRVECGRQARGGGEGGELGDGPRGRSLLVGEVRDGQRDAAGPAVGDPGLVEGRDPHLIAFPGLHPPEGVGPVLA